MAVIRTGEKLVRVQIYLELEDIKAIKRCAESNKRTFSEQARKFMSPLIKKYKELEKQQELEKKEENKPISDFSTSEPMLDFSSGPNIEFENE